MSLTKTRDELVTMDLQELLQYVSETDTAGAVLKCLQDAGNVLNREAIAQQEERTSAAATSAAAASAVPAVPAVEPAAAVPAAGSSSSLDQSERKFMFSNLDTSLQQEIEKEIEKYQNEKLFSIFKNIFQNIYPIEDMSSFNFLNSFCPIIVGGIIPSTRLKEEGKVYISYCYFEIDTTNKNIKLINSLVVGPNVSELKNINITTKSYVNAGDSSEPHKLTTLPHQCEFKFVETESGMFESTTWNEKCSTISNNFKTNLEKQSPDIVDNIKKTIQDLIITIDGSPSSSELPSDPRKKGETKPIKERYICSPLMIKAINICGTKVTTTTQSNLDGIKSHNLELKYFFKYNEGLKDAPIYKLDIPTRFGKLYDFKTMEEFTENYYGKTFNRLFKPKFEVNSFGNKVIKYYSR